MGKLNAACVLVRMAHHAGQQGRARATGLPVRSRHLGDPSPYAAGPVEVRTWSIRRAILPAGARRQPIMHKLQQTSVFFAVHRHHLDQQAVQA